MQSVIKRLLNNWQAKLVCLVIAVILWLAFKNKLEPGAFDQIISGTVPTSSR